MNSKERLLQKILSGSCNVRFTEMTLLVKRFGFRLSRIIGSNHIFTHLGVNALVNLQNVNGQAKPYQIKQFLSLVERHNLKMEK